MSDTKGNPDISQAREDLAFLKQIVEEHDPDLNVTGVVYGSAGLLYGLQCLLSWLGMIGLFAYEGMTALVISIVPTVLFIIVNIVAVAKNKKSMRESGLAARAVAACFAGAGIANGLLAFVIGGIAISKGDMSIWLIFPIVICAFQGGVWFAIAMVLRHAWMYWVAAGWYISSALTGYFFNDLAMYFLCLGLALFICMGLTGLKMARTKS